ncbi:hypothetical protein U0070_004733 [Myodes glareolus]|uniref:Uncharacterized protein n=1 Tax=Myodes glareolus TaxID=447135 RepID=A0AAW0HVA2_MYOGA
MQEQTLEQETPRDGGTIYSMIQYKSGSKKRSQNCSSSYTVYEEVGSQCLHTRNPARLSRRELENFDVYS